MTNSLDKRVVKSHYEGLTTTTINEAEYRRGIDITNAGTASLTVAVTTITATNPQLQTNVITFTVPGGSSYFNFFDPFKTLTITTTSQYYLDLLG